MRIAPTLEGGLRLDVETSFDWMLLRCIPADARGSSSELADRLNELMAEDPAAGDWREYVLPDLRAQFDGQISLIEEALKSPDDEPAEIVIHRADGDRWYGALNQARLALDARYHFSEDEDPDTLTPGKRTAWFRYNWYQQIQSLLLRFVLR
jgi:hypothetical protein